MSAEMQHIKTKHVSFDGEVVDLELTISLHGSGFERMMTVYVHRYDLGTEPVEVAHMRAEFSIVERL